MITKIIETLEQKGCKTLSKENLSAVIQCENSYLVKSPSDQWNLLVPSTKLLPLQKRIKTSFTPQNIDAGKFIRTGNWSRMFNFNINNEIRYNYNKDSIEQSKDKEIKKIVESMKDQEHFFSEDIKEFTIEDDYKENVNKLNERINTIVVSDLKKEFRSPIVCHSKPDVRKFWMPDGEKFAYRITTSCVVSGTKQTIENVLDANLNSATISQSDVRYISSRMTDDKNFMLSGIQLYQHGSEYPLLKFTLKDEDVLLKKSIISKIKKIEDGLATKNESDIKPIEVNAFTRYLF